MRAGGHGPKTTFSTPKFWGLAPGVTRAVVRPIILHAVVEADEAIEAAKRRGVLLQLKAKMPLTDGVRSGRGAAKVDEKQASARARYRLYVTSTEGGRCADRYPELCRTSGNSGVASGTAWLDGWV